jgi:quinoprotein glucose dehydrogenase
VKTTFVLLTFLTGCCFAQDNFRGWDTVGGTGANLHYSALDQINKDNVTRLRIAWTYDSGDAYPNSDVQCNPIVVDGVMYVTTAKTRVVALDAATGKQIWRFDGGNGRAMHPNRGVTYWTDGSQTRILVTIGHDLLSIDAKTGKLALDFGNQGKVDLRTAFDRPIEDISLTVTSPGTIYKDLIILGSSVSETLPATPGDIRAYDVRTGKLRWTFHTIPHPGEFGYDTWPPNAWKTSGAANNWAGMALDNKRGLVYVPTGSTAFDFYGADRHGDNLFADTLLCLDAATGKRKWHFQAVRHDVWDLDFPSAPTLITVRHQGQLVDAVAQAGKTGYIYVLNRVTGESLFPLEERVIAPSPVDGELLAKSQPVPMKPAPFVRQELTDDMATRRTEAAHQAVLEQLRTLDHGKLFIPPSLRGTVYFPGLAGGAEWGGSAYDPQTHVYYVNANELAWRVRLVTPESIHRTAKASQIYRARCSSCHGPDMKGAPPEYPALDQAAGRLTAAQISNILHKGSGRMPSFASLGEPAIAALQNLLLNKTDKEVEIQGRRRASPGLKYTVEGYRKFLDPDGYPATTPPWGTLSAVNLDTGDYLWKIPLGEYPELVAKGMKDTGTENHGGAVVTAGGLLFIGATHYDNKFRAFDKKTGKLLWETLLPFAANATPSVYELNGKEYVVVAAGGGRERPSGGLFIAFALP